MSTFFEFVNFCHRLKYLQGLYFSQKTALARSTTLAMDASMVTVPHLYQVNGKAVSPGESQVMNGKDGDTYEAANPKHCGYVLTFIKIIHVPFNKREAKQRERN